VALRCASRCSSLAMRLAERSTSSRRRFTSSAKVLDGAGRISTRRSSSRNSATFSARRRPAGGVRRRRARAAGQAGGSDRAEEAFEVVLGIPAQPFRELGDGVGELGVAVDAHIGKGAVAVLQDQRQVAQLDVDGHVRHIRVAGRLEHAVARHAHAQAPWPISMQATLPARRISVSRAQASWASRWLMVATLRKEEVDDIEACVQKKTALCWAVSILPVRRGTNPAARIVMAKILQNIR
jgi:hypothetical protein